MKLTLNTQSRLQSGRNKGMEKPSTPRNGQRGETDRVPAIDSKDLRHLVIHQAAGMVSVQLGVDVSEALRRLQVYATDAGRELVDVAQEVVDRRIRFNTDSEG